MKKAYSILLYLLLIEMILTSCNKQTSEINSSSGNVENNPPVADAGADQTIFFPTNFVTLDGSGSSDPNNNISNFTWEKISGPSSFTIATANAVQTQVINLVEGVYQFELKVTDAGGLVSRDTVQVRVGHPANEYIIDMTFDINQSCYITGPYPGPYYSEASFSLKATSNTDPSGGNQPFRAVIDQYAEKYASYYYEAAYISISGTLNNIPNSSLYMEFLSNIVFFELPYNNGPVSFSDSCFIIGGQGFFANIVPNSKLYCSGVADLKNNKGSIRLKGAIYY